MKITDISVGFLHCSVYPGDPEPGAVSLCTFDRDGYMVTTVNACLHTGTHIDAPLHFIEGGKSADELEPEIFMGPCRVIELPGGPVDADKLPDGAERLLIKSGGKAYFTAESAETAAAKGIKLIGTDGLSIGSPEDEKGPHTAFLSAGIPILEVLNLENVIPGEYNLTALPLLAEGLEAAPARAVLEDKN